MAVGAPGCSRKVIGSAIKPFENRLVGFFIDNFSLAIATEPMLQTFFAKSISLVVI